MCYYKQTNKNHAPVILVIVVFVIEAGHRGSTTSTSVQLTSYLFIWNFHIFDAPKGKYFNDEL